MQIIPGPTGLKISKHLSSLLDLPLLIPKYRTFADGESHLRIDGKIADKVIVVQSCYAPQDTNLFQALNLIATLKRLANPYVILYTPYLCYARADRDILGGESISIATVLDLLDSVGTDHLITLDVHNPDVLFGAKFETTNIFPVKSFKEYLESKFDDFTQFQVVAPDKGAITRAEMFARELGISYTHLNKTRDPSTGTIDIDIGSANLNTRNIIIVDDIISTGSTLVEASTLLKIHGIENIHYLISHAIGTEAIDKLKEIGNGVVVATNSIPNLMGIVSSAPDLASVLNEMGY